MEAKEVKGLWEAYVSVYTNLSESHFKVGDKVICKKSGMKGEVVKLDKPDGAEDEKYYTVEREDGKKMKYAPNELKSAGNGGASKEKETKFHTKLDKLVHSTFGSSPEEKKMKEEVELDEEAPKRVGVKPASPRLVKGYPSRVHDPSKPSASKMVKKVDEETDLFDYILEHLVAEGYAETNEAALVIMANMSEEWRQSILDEGYQEPRFGKKQYITKLSKRGGMGMGTPEDPHGYRDPKMAKVGAELSKRKTAAAKAKKTGGPDEYRAEKEAQSKKR